MADAEIPAAPGSALDAPEGTRLPSAPDYWAQEQPSGQPPHPSYNPTPEETDQLTRIGNNESQGDYSLLHGPGGHHVGDLSAFPQWEGFQGPGGTSHAAGKYGFEPGTYNEAAQHTGYSDFTPASQDANALWLLRQYGPNSPHSWQASGPYPEAAKPVPMPAAGSAVGSGPRNLGPFQSEFDAYDAAPKDRGSYNLLEDNGSYHWVPKSADTHVGPSPFFNSSRNDQAVADQILNGPHSDKHSWGTALTDVGRGFNSILANTLDLPATLTDTGMRALYSGLGWGSPSFQFGHPVNNLLNKLGIDTEKKGEGWASTMGFGVGSGLGMTATALIPGAAVGSAADLGAVTQGTRLGTALAPETVGATAPQAGASAARAVGFNPAKPLSSAVNELLLGAGSGEFQQEAHELYKGQTGREGDLGDYLTQLIAGGGFNMARVGGVSAIEKAWDAAHQGAKLAKSNLAAANAQGVPAPNSPDVQDFRTARGYDPNTPLDQSTPPLDAQMGKQLVDQVLSKQLSDKLDVARDHVEALGTVAPEQSATALAEHSEAARAAVSNFLAGSREDERQLWSPASGVNLAMPRDFTNVQQLVQQMKADHFDPARLRNPESWPTAAEQLINPRQQAAPAMPSGLLDAQGNPLVAAGAPPRGLQAQDTLGRGQDARSQIGQMIEDEMAVQGRSQDAAKIGYLQKMRNGLTDALGGTEGSDSPEIDAYRKAMAFSAGRAQLTESPEMQAFLRTGEAQALDKFIKTGPQGAQAAQILTGAAQQKYGAEGLLGAAKDAVRQKYSDAVASNGYISQADHARFMSNYSGILQHPAFEDVTNQFNTAAAAEGDVNATVGFGRPGGFGKSGSALETREARAENYLQAPGRTVLDHLEGTSNQFTATRNALDEVAADPTGQATLGFQHMVADRALANPNYAANNPGMIEAIDRINPGFADRLNALTTPTSLGGIAKKLVDFGSSYVGAQVGGKLAKHMGSSMVMAGRGAEAVRDLTKNGLQKLTGISSAMVVDPAVADAWARKWQGLGAGNIGDQSAQMAADMLLFHAYVPGFIFGNLPSGPEAGTGQPGSPVTNAGPPSEQGPTGQPWYKSTPSYAPGARKS